MSFIAVAETLNAVNVSTFLPAAKLTGLVIQNMNLNQESVVPALKNETNHDSS